jgi:tetratricopeptide (TPR) repeat protein
MRAAWVPLTMLIGMPGLAMACLWDYDTIKMERARFPSTLELITGKFLRHSPEFYHWRIADRLKKLEADSTNPALLDDLAVAYDKTGQHEKAIEIAKKTEHLYPGRYETAANLGTFYFHAGRLEEGLPHIERALRINPNAHFGREQYQKLLVEYVLSRRAEGNTRLPLMSIIPHQHLASTLTANDFGYEKGFADFLARKARESTSNTLVESQRADAIKGILGMMKFGNHASPVLLEALGSLLANNSTAPTQDAKMLAARAYLKASYEVADESARQDYRRLAEKVLMMQTIRPNSMTQLTLDQVEREFQKELNEAHQWYAELRERELSWIRDGKDPEVEFDRLYIEEPHVSGLEHDEALTLLKLLDCIGRSIAAVGVVVMVAGLGLMLGYLRYRKIRHGGQDMVR